MIVVWIPLLIVGVLAVGLKRPARDLSLAAYASCTALALGPLQTPLKVVLLATVDGLLTAAPLLLVVFGGILLSRIITETGGFERLVKWLLGGVRNEEQRGLLIAVGVGNFMEGAGVIAEPVLAPMLRASGADRRGAAVLSVLGYAGLMTLALGGIILTVLSLVTGLPLQPLAEAAAWLSLAAMLLSAPAIPFYLPIGKDAVWRHVPLAMVCAGLAAGGGLIVVALGAPSIGAMIGGLIACALLIGIGNRRLPGLREVAGDLLPFALILAALLAVNFVGPVRALTRENLVLRLAVTPVHTVTLRPLADAYLYLLLASAVALWRAPAARAQTKVILRDSLGQFLRVLVVMAGFGACGQVLASTGYGSDWSGPMENLHAPVLMAQGLQAASGTLFVALVPFLGWTGTFLTGFTVAALMLFGPLVVSAGANLGVDPIWLAAGLTVGSAVGSISSPFKIAFATSLVGIVGEEGSILRRTVPLGMGISLALGALLLVVV